MDNDNSPEQSKPQDSRKVTPNVLLTEPLFANITYALNLRHMDSPLFYNLSRQIIDHISHDNPSPSLQDIVTSLNTLCPKVETDLSNYNRIKQSYEFEIPIDAFFNTDSHAAAQCLERSLLTQLVFAHFGYETRLESLKGTSINPNEPPLNHIILTMENADGPPLIIDSNNEGNSPVSLENKNSHLNKLRRMYSNISEVNITENAFSPITPLSSSPPPSSSAPS